MVVPPYTGCMLPDNNTYIITQTLTSNLSPSLPTQPLPVPSTCHPLAGTATNNNHSNTLTTHAPAMTSTLLPSYLHPSMPTLHHWCSTFLLYDYTWCSLPKSHTTLDVAFYLHSQSFPYISLILYSLTFAPTFMQQRYSDFPFPYL